MADTMLVNPDLTYDLTYIHMDIQVRPDTEYVAGSVLFRGTAIHSPYIDRIQLTLRPQILFDSAKTENGDTLAFTRDGERIFVSLERPMQPGENFGVRVFYHGFSTEPDRIGLIHTTQNPDGTGPFIIWTRSEPYGAKNWWPVRDNPAEKIDSADLWFTCDTKYKVASNGLLTDVTPAGDGKHTFKWKSRYPIAHYLIAFACSEYDTFTTHWKYSETDSLPIQNFVYPGQAEQWRTGLSNVPDMLTTFTDWFGEYPFIKEKYGHTQWRGGGMEYQTNSFVNWYDTELIAHELIHQWWGDAITCATWSDIWINEGVTTYYTSRYMGKVNGGDFHRVDMARKERFITEVPNGSVYVPNDSLADKSRVFSARTTYDKGAWVMHMLRYVLGDSTFDATMKAMMNSPFRYQSINSMQFVTFVETQTGRDLKKFFGQWLMAEGYPQYQFSPQSSPLFGRWRTMIYLDQVPSGTPVFYEMPVQVRVEGDGWDTLLLLNNTQFQQSWDMMFEREPKRFVFDPFNDLLDGRVDQYLTVTDQSGDGVVRLQPNPVQRGGSLKLSMMFGYSMTGYEVYDPRGAVVLRDTGVTNVDATEIPVQSLPSGAYSIRVHLTSDHGEATERLEKFIVE